MLLSVTLLLLSDVASENPGPPALSEVPVTIVANAPGGGFHVSFTDAAGAHSCPREVNLIDPCRLSLALGPATLAASGSENLDLHFKVRRAGETLVLQRFITDVPSIRAVGLDLFSFFVLLPAFGLGCGIPAAESHDRVRREALLLGCLLPGLVGTAVAAIVPWFVGPKSVWEACVAGTEGCSPEFPRPPLISQ